MRTFILFLLLFLFALPLFSQVFWEEIPLPDSISIYEIYGINENHILIGGSNGLYSTFDGGENWEHSIQNVHACFTINAYKNRYYAKVSNGLYRKSGIEGEWELISVGKGVISGNFCFINDTVIYAGRNGAIQKTTDGGYTWEILYQGESNEVFRSIAQHPSGILFAGSLSYDAYTISGLYKSEDEGETWDRFAFHNLSNDFVRINDKGDIYVGSFQDPIGGYGGIYKSTNLGYDWDTLRNDLHVTGLVILPGETIYASGQYGATAGVTMSVDGGITWQDVTTGIEYPAIYKLELGKDGHLYAVSDASQDKIYRSVDAVTVHNSHNSDLLADQPLIYPNPAYERINIKLNSNNPISELLIYTINGQQVLSKSLNQNLNSIDVSSLSDGTYIIRIRNFSTTFNQLFIKH